MACVIFCTFFEVDKWRRLCQLALINSDRDGIRKAREGFLISKGKPLEPYGINRRDEIYSIDIYFYVLNLFIQVFVHCIPPQITFYFLFLYLILFIYRDRLFYSHLAFPAPGED